MAGQGRAFLGAWKGGGGGSEGGQKKGIHSAAEGRAQVRGGAARAYEGGQDGAPCGAPQCHGGCLRPAVAASALIGEADSNRRMEEIRDPIGRAKRKPGHGFVLCPRRKGREGAEGLESGRSAGSALNFIPELREFG